MNSDRLPPPFVVGEKYWDRNGEYTVTAAAASQVTIEHQDGRRMTADAALLARIHRNVLADRDAGGERDRLSRATRRRQPTRREKGLIDRILQLESDGANHTGVEIDHCLADVARALGYTDEDISSLHATGRTVFGNEGDWAKAKMTEDRWHDVVGTTAHWQSGSRRECNVYRITPRGLDELRKRG
jgi:hypothetical protein